MSLYPDVQEDSTLCSGNNSREKMMDFKVRNAGIVWTFEPLSDNAKEFASGIGLEGWQWMGKTFVLDARIADNFLTNLEAEGFEIEFLV